MRCFQFAALLFLAGCTSGVVPAGPNTYMISGSSPGLIGAGTVKTKLLKEANAWCSKNDLVMIPLDAKGRDAIAGGNWANAELTFMAVNSEQAKRLDSAFARQPNEVVEIRER